MFKSVKSNISTTREFKYTKDKCNLSFTLNLDDKKELLSFQECLEKALEDVKKSIK